MAVDRKNDVVLLQSCSFAATAFNDIGNAHATRFAKAECFGFGCIDGADVHADIAAVDSAILNDVGGNGPRHIDRNGKAVALEHTSLRCDGRVNPNDLAFEVIEAATGVTGIDRSIGLNKIVDSVTFRIGVDADPASKRADNTLCDR